MIDSYIRLKLKPLALVFPRFASATVMTSSFDWFTGSAVFFVIGWSDNFGFSSSYDNLLCVDNL